MSETKWTPGPWRVKGAAGGTATVHAREGTPAICSTPGNARLIAAAPELYDALALVRASLGWQYLSVDSRAVIDAALLKAREA